MNLNEAKTSIDETVTDVADRLADLYTDTGGKKYSDTIHAQQAAAVVDLYDLDIEAPVRVAEREQQAAELDTAHAAIPALCEAGRGDVRPGRLGGAGRRGGQSTTTPVHPLKYTARFVSQTSESV